MTKARDLADLIAAGNPLADGAISVAEISDLTASAAEINKLDGLVASTAELNNVVGTTSALQTQLDNISVTSGSLTKSFASGETASITLAQAISPAPVVSATKEVPQVGVVSKGAWDVNASASNYDLHNTAYSTTLTPGGVGYLDLGSATYASKSFSVASQITGPLGTAFSTDGTKMYVCGESGFVYQYTLSTAWDASTASYSTSWDGTGVTSNIGGLHFKTDGTVLFLACPLGDEIRRVNLSTAWDVSTATDQNSNFNVNSYDTSIQGLWFKPDGTKMYMIGQNSYRVQGFNLSTAWDHTTATASGSKSVGVLDNSPQGVAFSSDGTKMYIAGGTNTKVFQYLLSTAWDVTTASGAGPVFLDVSGQDTQSTLKDVTFGNDGNILYITSKGGSSVFQYDTSAPALVLGTGSFASTDVGKRIVGNGGDVTLTSTAGAYDTTGGSAFTDTSTIASGSWSMRGLKSVGDADGIGMPSVSNVYDVSNATATGNTFSVATQSASLLHMTFSPDGTKFYVIDYTNGYMMQYGCTTAFDLTTASYSSKTFYSYQQDGQPAAARFNPAGTSMFIAGRNNDRVYQYSLSTAYDISTASYSTSWAPSSGKVNAGFADILFNNDGSFIYTLDYNTDVIGQFACPNEYQLSGVSSDSTYEYSLPTNSIATPQGMSFNSDGTKMYIIATNNKIDIYTLSTAYRVSTMSYSSTISINGGNMALDFSADGTKLFVASRESDNIIEYSVGEIFTPTSQYHVAVTNSGGQIDTSNWLDLNTMVADQAAGDGTVHYAVSTDDRTTWSVIKEGSGVRPIVRDNSGTWQYNSDAGSLTGAYDLSTAVFNKSKSVASDTSDPYGIIFKPDGTKMFVLDDGFAAADDVLEYGLSTAWDISTATFTQAYRLLSSEAAVQGMDFKSDGTQVYVVGSITDAVYAYDLSTAWDISTASYNSVNFSTTSQTTTPFAVKFKADGAKMYVIGSAQDTIYEYNLSTSWDISTASYNNVSYYFNSQVAAAHNLTFNSAGTKLYLAGSGAVYEYNLSTAWDLSSISYSNVSFSVSESEGITFKPDGTKMFMCGSSNDLVVEYDIGSIGYGTSTTWANSTTNDEFYALQQALGYNAFNRMDKTQLDAVTDPNHYTLGDTLDLAIALRMDTASASTPTADGVTINYDAASLNQGAVLGTDYDYDFPDSTTVRVTSNAAQNLKVRVV